LPDGGRKAVLFLKPVLDEVNLFVFGCEHVLLLSQTAFSFLCTNVHRDVQKKMHRCSSQGLKI